MPLTNFPNGVSSFGMPLIGMTTGNVFFVDSVTGSNGNSGKDKSNPFATVDYAINQCTANKGDVIFVMPGHAETGTTAALFDVDVAGVSIIGLGNGDDRPAFTLGTSTACDVDLNADGVLIRNLKFDLTGVDAIVEGLDVDGSHITIEDCEIIMADTGGQAVTAVDLGASSHFFTFQRNRVTANVAGAAEAILIGDTAAVSNDILIENNYFNGAFSVAAITNSAAAACLRVKISHNDIINVTSGKDGISIGATTVGLTGIISHNFIGLTGTAGGTMVAKTGQTRLFRNYLATHATLQGELLPAEDGVST